MFSAISQKNADLRGVGNFPSSDGKRPSQGKAVPLQTWTGLDKPRGFQEVKVPKFHDGRHIEPCIPAVFTPHPLGNISGTHYC
jgi:hypothetical protein